MIGRSLRPAESAGGGHASAQHTEIGRGRPGDPGLNSRALLGALLGFGESELRQVRGGVIKPCPPGQNLATQRPCLAADTAAEVAVGTPLATSPHRLARATRAAGPANRPPPPPPPPRPRPRGEIGRGPRACQANPKRTEATPPRSGGLQQPGSPPAPGRTGGEALNSTLPGRLFLRWRTQSSSSSLLFSKKRFAICNFGESMPPLALS